MPLFNLKWRRPFDLAVKEEPSTIFCLCFTVAWWVQILSFFSRPNIFMWNNIDGHVCTCRYTFQRNEFGEPDDVGGRHQRCESLLQCEKCHTGFHLTVWADLCSRSQLPRQPEIQVWVCAENPYESGWTQGHHQNTATENQAVHVKGATGSKWQWDKGFAFDLLFCLVVFWTELHLNMVGTESNLLWMVDTVVQENHLS